MEMSKKAYKRHIRTGGMDGCPYCKEDVLGDIEWEEMEPVEDGTIEQKVKCLKCGKRWMDVFKLTAVKELFSESECNKPIHGGQ